MRRQPAAAAKFLTTPECAVQEAVFPLKSRGMGVRSWLSALSSYGFPLSRWEWPNEGRRLEQLIGEGALGRFSRPLSAPTLERTRRSCRRLVSWQCPTHHRVAGMEEEEDGANARSLPQIGVWGCRRLEPAVSIPPAPPCPRWRSGRLISVP